MRPVCPAERANLCSQTKDDFADRFADKLARFSAKAQRASHRGVPDVILSLDRGDDSRMVHNVQVLSLNIDAQTSAAGKSHNATMKEQVERKPQNETAHSPYK